MTLDTPLAGAAPAPSGGHATRAPGAAESTGALTRAEYRRLAAAAVSAPAPSAESSVEHAGHESLAESVVADVAAAIIAAESFATAPDHRSRRRLRRAAEAALASVANAEPTPVDADPRPAAESVFAAAPECARDEFEFAARLFSFTGEVPLVRAEARNQTDGEGTAPKPAAEASLPVARRPRRARVIAQRIAAASLSVSAMSVVGLLAVGTTTPAAAVAAPATSTVDLTTTATAETGTDEIQAFVASGATGAGTLDRPENYDIASMADIAAESGVTLFAGTWVNDPDAAIQWPFPVGVPISAAYGSSTYLAQFSSPHRGVDLTPGLGAEVHVIAAGTVRIAT
ncbi:MAG TPA: M23 family peptidase, partial [Microbacterium sp.]|nr:M23 family peptidase [Microbacterium sp.]